MGHKIRCEDCRGQGETFGTYPGGIGGGYQKCDSCDGKGHTVVACKTCQDSGEIDEEKHHDFHGWEGRGYMDRGVDMWDSCDDCEGTGQEPCGVCDGGAAFDDDATCAFCDDSGWIACSACDGEGTHSMYCDDCMKPFERGDGVFWGDHGLYCDSCADLRCPDCAPVDVVTTPLKGPDEGAVFLQVSRVKSDPEDFDTLWTVRYPKEDTDAPELIADALYEVEAQGLVAKEAFDYLRAVIGPPLLRRILDQYPEHSWSQRKYAEAVNVAQRLGVSL